MHQRPPTSQVAIAAMIAALLALAARDATRLQLAECGGLIRGAMRGAVDGAMTDAPQSVRAVAKAIVAAVRDLVDDRGAPILDCTPPRAGWAGAVASPAALGGPALPQTRPHERPIRAELLSLPPPLA